MRLLMSATAFLELLGLKTGASVALMGAGGKHTLMARLKQEFTQHIPAKVSHLIRYYGWYSNKARGRRKKAEAESSGRAVERGRRFRCGSWWL